MLLFTRLKETHISVTAMYGNDPLPIRETIILTSYSVTPGRDAVLPTSSFDIPANLDLLEHL